jgi:hypothetical protein
MMRGSMMRGSMMLAPPMASPARPIARTTRSTREARLLPSAAHHYPWIEAGRWQPAALLADQVLAGHPLRGTHSVTCRRLLPDAHFAFRGGTARGDAEDAAGPRREDR